MTETVVAILISIAVFTLIILVLVSVLMFAAAKLIRQDDCKILINDDEEKSLADRVGWPGISACPQCRPDGARRTWR